ncbi:MAG: asparagine synthase (glutamine-hydrolyzing) [Desulfobacterales bacterium]
MRCLRESKLFEKNVFRGAKLCGIAGYKTIRTRDPAILRQMVNALYHRGPDSEGYFHGQYFSAGMRRLTINDLYTGDQPLFNEDKSVVLFYNGEIYNYPELRKDLESKDHHFRTHSDGEVICHLYEDLQENLFEKIDGMFAVALWIETEQKLILARDIPGEKPLYYIKISDNELVFASEIKSLLKFPGWVKELNLQALWDFPTFLWIPEPETVYKSVMALPRGHILIADKFGIRIRPYGNKFNQKEIPLEEASVIQETRQVVTEAIHSRLMSDVPVGSFLSSGLDSSIVTSVAASILPDLKTFTIGFENVLDPYHGTADESFHAEAFADDLGLEHHTIRVSAEDFKNDLLKFCIHSDQPFSVSSGLGILSVARAAREKEVKVLLSGDGADECFGGYSWYVHLDQQNTIDHDFSDEDSDISFQNFGLNLSERLNQITKYSPQKRAWAWHYYAAESEKKRLYNKEYFGSVKTSLHNFYEFNPDDIWQPEDFIKQDRQFYFPNEMLRKVDRMTMAFSVEGRTPFSAPSVLAHSDKLKYSHMVRNNSLKWALREAFSHILPKSVYLRPKHGFNVPIDHWLKNEWGYLVEETFCSNSALMKLGLIHEKSRDSAIQMINDPHRLNGHTIFSFIILNLWIENVYGNHC